MTYFHANTRFFAYFQVINDFFLERRRIAVIIKAPGQSFLVLLRETRVQFPVTAFTITMVKLVVALGLVCP